jgi:hypothetical protein
MVLAFLVASFSLSGATAGCGDRRGDGTGRSLGESCDATRPCSNPWICKAAGSGARCACCVRRSFDGIEYDSCAFDLDLWGNCAAEVDTLP